MYEFTFPFKPPMEDCRMQFVHPNGAHIYIFDTFCKNQTPEERERIDTEFVRVYNDILARQELRRLEQAEGNHNENA